MTALCDSAIGYAGALLAPACTGRRIRVFVRCVTHMHGGVAFSSYVPFQNPPVFMPFADPITYGELITAINLGSYFTHERKVLSCLKLREKQTHDPEVCELLQDMADDFIHDVHDACEAFDTPQLYYPGVDPPLIEPVPDTHVVTVISALQRELTRETRPGGRSGQQLPGVQLNQLPFRIQRALVERRRLRFAEYGIGMKEYETGIWSLWNVREDPDWSPR